VSSVEDFFRKIAASNHADTLGRPQTHTNPPPPTTKHRIYVQDGSATDGGSMKSNSTTKRLPNYEDDHPNLTRITTKNEHPIILPPKKQQQEVVQVQENVSDLSPEEEEFIKGYKVPPAEEILNERLGLYGLREKTKIKGDGNCQFASCADQLFNDPNKHSEVRKAAVSWLRRNSSYRLPNQTTLLDYLQTEFFPTWADYCDYMDQAGIWGDHFPLFAIAEVYSVKIVVVSSMEVDPGIDPFTVVVPQEWDDSKPVIYLAHRHELHYSSVCLDE